MFFHLKPKYGKLRWQTQPDIEKIKTWLKLTSDHPFFKKVLEILRLIDMNTKQISLQPWCNIMDLIYGNFVKTYSSKILQKLSLWVVFEAVLCLFSTLSNYLGKNC